MFHSFFAYWYTDHVCQLSWESDKNCRKSSNLKTVWRHTSTQTDRQTPIL